VHLRVASSTNDDVTPVLYAQANGLFRAAGIDVEIQAVNNGAAVAAAVAGGAADLGRSSMLPLISAHSRGIPLTLVAPSGVFVSAEPTSGILVVKDGPIRTARDLNGKIVSVPGLNDVLSVATRAWIDKNGGDSESIRFVETTGSQVSVALDAARVAAGTVVNPQMAQSLTTGRYRLLGDAVTGIATRFLQAAWFADADYVAKHGATIRKFSAIIQKASAYCNLHTQQTIDLLSRFSGIDVATIAHMARTKYDLTLDPSDIQPLIDAAAKYKAIPKSFDAREMISEYAVK